jgi:hypothetical protein
MYECKSSFTAKNGVYYSYGKEISTSEYNRLDYLEKYNFREKSISSSANSYSGYNSPSIDYSSLNSFTSDNSSSSSSDSSSSSFDFGGGSGGGAGSGGDW